MKLVGRKVFAIVENTPDSGLPVRMHLGGMTFGLTPDEAITLSNSLTDAVETIEKERKSNE